MSTVKVNKEFTKQIIEGAYNAASLHADSKNDFGLFCMGVGVAFRSLFEFLQKENHLSEMEINILQSTIHTSALIKSFQEAKEDIAVAEREGKDNKELSAKILRIAKIARGEEK